MTELSIPQSVCVVPFGCQMNRADAGMIAKLFGEQGFTLVEDEDAADAVIYITCAVRQHAENRALSRLGRHGRRKRDGKKVIVALAGCVAEKLGRDAFKIVPGLNIVCGTRCFNSLPQLVEQAGVSDAQIVAIGLDDIPSDEQGAHFKTSPFQAFVNIMQGCDNFCAYCIVPYVRGREYSRPLNHILDEVKKLAAEGVVEITFLGQNVNSYGKGLHGNVRLADLLAAVSQVDGIQRIKFVTSHPKDLSADLIAALNLPKVSPYLHLPAQSGSSAILKAMNRGYTREHYLDLIARVRHIAPQVAIASDFIVGFPSETESDYLQTRDMIEQVRFSQVFIFKYSPRPGTAAAKLPDDVPDDVKKARNNELLSLHMRIAAQDNAKLIGELIEVLIEGASPRNAQRLIGRSPTDRIVIVDSTNFSLAGQILPARITSSTALALYGELVQ